MAKRQAKHEPEIRDYDIMVETTKTVIGVTQAEALQRSGWRLISVTLTPEGKQYKFER